MSVTKGSRTIPKKRLENSLGNRKPLRAHYNYQLALEHTYVKFINTILNILKSKLTIIYFQKIENNEI